MFPNLSGYSASDLDFRTAEAFDLPVEPWVPFTNSMDFQHLRVLHGLKIECDPDQIDVGRLQIQYDVRFEDPQLGIFDQSHPRQRHQHYRAVRKLNGMAMLSMATGTPTPDGRTHGWSVTATPRAEGDDASASNASRSGRPSSTASSRKTADHEAPFAFTRACSSTPTARSRAFCNTCAASQPRAPPPTKRLEAKSWLG